MGAQTEATTLGDFQRVDEALHQPREAFVLPLAQEVVAGGGRPCESHAGLAIGMGKKPRIELVTQTLKLGNDFGRIGRNDQEFSSDVDDLARRREPQRIQQAQRGNLGEERDLKRAPAQQFGRLLARFAAAGEDEILDAEKVSLNKEELLLREVFPGLEAACGLGIAFTTRLVPAPQCRRKCSGGTGMVVKRYLRFDAEGRGRRDGVGEGEPQTIEMIQP